MPNLFRSYFRGSQVSFESLMIDLREFDKFKSPFDAGIDCAKNGANEDNCHFGWFSTPERTAEWERGKQSTSEAKHD